MLTAITVAKLLHADLFNNFYYELLVIYALKLNAFY